MYVGDCTIVLIAIYINQCVYYAINSSPMSNKFTVATQHINSNTIQYMYSLLQLHNTSMVIQYNTIHAYTGTVCIVYYSYTTHQ